MRNRHSSARMANQPFFTVDGDRFVPTDAGRGPWDPKSLHGRVIIGLLGGERSGSRYMSTVSRVVRDGYRIKVIDAEFISGGVSAGRATCQLLRRTEAPGGVVWTPPAWEVPAPEELPPPEPTNHPLGGMWAMRRIAGDWGSFGQKRTWMSEVRELVEGRPLTPFVRVAVAADFTSPFANSGDQGLKYIPPDVTLYLPRQPVGEWVGFEVVNHGATDGVAIGESFLYDVEGAIGSASCCALAQKRGA